MLAVPINGNWLLAQPSIRWLPRQAVSSLWTRAEISSLIPRIWFRRLWNSKCVCVFARGVVIFIVSRRAAHKHVEASQKSGNTPPPWISLSATRKRTAFSDMQRANSLMFRWRVVPHESVPTSKTNDRCLSVCILRFLLGYVTLVMIIPTDRQYKNQCAFAQQTNVMMCSDQWSDRVMWRQCVALGVVNARVQHDWRLVETNATSPRYEHIYAIL